jgi:hypothetical protein
MRSTAYTEYVVKSMQIFFFCFILGIYVDKKFYEYQNSIQNIHQIQRVFIGLAQLFVIISITYVLHSIKFFHEFFEEYTPNVLFSTFLFSLQTNMIQNFKDFVV